MFPLLEFPGGWELIVIALVIIVLFGAKKLPEFARGTGQALRIFKAETKGLRDDDTATTATSDADPKAADKPIEGRVVDTQRDTNAG
ncbi:MAG: Sec-independent protein translocase subunit TatA [Nocardioidaceae bacterium]|nr:Sec-independent protein translocase subunit TatA [Nocardioidaceae bacterium]MCL2614628.1 Sec-independent protein translocase subunit TatA [Nocardioidaceae bacterium]